MEETLLAHFNLFKIRNFTLAKILLRKVQSDDTIVFKKKEFFKFLNIFIRKSLKKHYHIILMHIK